jgi:hypothetical protein
MNKMKKLIHVLLFLLLFTAGYSTTWIPSSLTQNSYQIAIDSAAKYPGDTVRCLPGNVRCGGPAYLSINNKNIVIRGAQLYGEDTTFVCDTSHASYLDCAMYIQGSGNTVTRVEGITFRGDSARAYNQGMLAVNAPHWKGLRISGCTFNKHANNAMWIKSWGLISECTFDGRVAAGRGIAADGDNTEWDSDSVYFGTDSSLVVEDCNFIRDTTVGSINKGAVDAGSGAHVIFRYNTITHMHYLTHDRCRTINTKGAVASEVYCNSMSALRADGYVGVNIASGTGVCFNNALTGPETWKNWDAVIKLMDYPTCAGVGYACAAGVDTCNGGATIDGNSAEDSGSVTWASGTQLKSTGHVFDEYLYWYCYNVTDGSKGKIVSVHLDTLTAELYGGLDNTFQPGDSFYISNGYPCYAQPGYGASQKQMPIYEWGNSLNGALSGVEIGAFSGCVNPNDSDHIKDGRDFYTNTIDNNYVARIYPDPRRGLPRTMDIEELDKVTYKRGETVALSGSGFKTSKGNGTVKIENTVLNTTLWSNISVSATLPSNIEDGTYNLYLKNNDMQQDTIQIIINSFIRKLNKHVIDR